MRNLKTALFTLIFVFVAGLLHYVLPQHDVARVTGSEIIRMDFSATNRLFFAQSDSGNVELTTRDVRLINAQRKRSFLLGFVRRDAEGVMVYRNEDTGWIWPPYFKFDSSDLQASASANMSAPGAEQWVVITHYGWRNRFLTIFPNAIAIRPVDGPDVRVIPWFNIAFFVFLIVAFFFLRAMWRQFRERSIDPLIEDAGDAYGRVGEHAAEHRGRIARWLDSWRGPKQR